MSGSDIIVILLRTRAATAERRRDKWHGTLELSRTWERRGITWPVLLGALAGFGVLFGSAKLTPYIAVVMGLLTALLGSRAATARQYLSTAQADKAWLSADRLATQYQTLLALLDSGQGDPLVLLEASDLLENGAARFGVPEPTRLALLSASACVHRRRERLSTPVAERAA